MLGLVCGRVTSCVIQSSRGIGHAEEKEEGEKEKRKKTPWAESKEWFTQGSMNVV